MPLVKNLLLGGLTTLAAGGTGAGVWMMVQRNNAAQSENTKIQTGIVVGPDAEETKEPKDQIRQAGLNCGDATTEKDCNIGSTGLNVDISNTKKEGLFPIEGENGNIKFRLSEETNTYSNGYRFTITEKPIKLQNKDKTSGIVTLEKYENYGLVKDSAANKVYLTRKLTANEGKIKSLGLPEKCTLPATVSSEPFKYESATCELTKDEIKSVNFDGKKDGGATTDGNVKLYIHKVNDSKTFRGGYKFTFHPFNEVEISSGNKLIKDVWWDFRIKDPDADDLVLERIWKSEKDLLDAVGLSCPNDTCTITEGSLKIKVGETSMEDGKKKADGGSTGTLKLERNKAGHYEGLRFSVQDGGITIVSNSSPASTVKMEEMEIFHIRKEDKNDSSYYLTRKHDLEEMIFFYLGLDKNGCTLPKNGNNTTCSVQGRTENNPLGKIKFHDGTGEKTITNNTSSKLSITIAKEGDETAYPFGYKFSIKTDSGDIKVGSITLGSGTATDFKIKKESGPKLYLEKVN